jgi:guanyl-specific ribonuclease Sa
VRAAFIGLAIAAIATVAGGCELAPATSPGVAAPPATVASGVPAPAASVSGLPNLGSAERKVLAVLEVIDRTGQAPAGYRGGTQFMNDGRDAGQVLPRKDAQGKSISYREWDVNPYTGANRGTERLVTGSDGSAWYTNDHYNTFVRIR